MRRVRPACGFFGSFGASPLDVPFFILAISQVPTVIRWFALLIIAHDFDFYIECSLEALPEVAQGGRPVGVALLECLARYRIQTYRPRSLRAFVVD
jgi:hypothetical protein